KPIEVRTGNGDSIGTEERGGGLLVEAFLGMDTGSERARRVNDAGSPARELRVQAASAEAGALNN
ncbi:hypothetical protein A2U01_0061738, partial [Trifolium medium]|nr:hypothetical protein [Trifolium medium]